MTPAQDVDLDIQNTGALPAPDAAPPTVSAGAMIVCQGVTKRYEPNVLALDNISFQIDKGEFVFIVGASGSGKSTLIRLLLKGMEPTRGTIIVGGRDIGRVSPARVSQRGRNIGCVFQDFKLLPNRSAAAVSYTHL